MVTENQIYEESDIDLGKYAKVIIKNKHVFFAILLLSLIVGICMIRFSPKIYKVSMMIKPPNLEEYFSNDKELENAEILKGLIVNSVFNEELFKRIKPNNIEIESIKFNAEIPDKTNVLLVNLDWDSKTKDLGVAMLNNLIDVISANYTQRVMVKNNEIVNRVKFNELAISNDKEKIKSIKNQIAEAEKRDNELREQIKTINDNTSVIMSRREKLIKNKSSEDASAMLLTNYLQNNADYLSQIYGQISELSIKRINFNMELKNLDSEIINYQTLIDQLNAKKEFISNLIVISPPRISRSPISPNKKQIMIISIAIGLILGASAAFSKEYLSNNFRKAN